MQFVFAPIWGRISDSTGRRPVILLGLVGTIIGFSLLAITALLFSTSIFMLFLSRIVAGTFTAATLPTSQAYIADTTTGKDRVKGFGLIGAAFGLGFAIGPAIGGILSIWGYAAPALFATGLAVINLIAEIRNLPESLPKTVRDELKSNKAANKSTTRLYHIVISNPTISLILIIFAILSLAFSGMESTLALYGENRFGLNESLTGVVFLVMGLVAIITQGGLIRPFSHKFTDSHLAATGLLLVTIGFIGISTINTLGALIIWVIPLVFGFSMTNPTLGALLSKKTPPDNSGAILGLNQGLGSLMRILGPLEATFLFEKNVVYPYYIGAILVVICLVFAIVLISVSKDHIPIEISPKTCTRLENE